MSSQDMGTPIETGQTTTIGKATPDSSHLSKKEARSVARLDNSFKTIAWVLQRHVSIDATGSLQQELSNYGNLLGIPEERLTPPAYTDSEGNYYTGSLTAQTKEETSRDYERRVNSTANLLIAGSFRIDTTELEQVLKEDGQPHQVVETDIREAQDRFKAVSGKQRLTMAEGVAKRVDAGLARHAVRYITLWAGLKTDAGQVPQGTRSGVFMDLPEDKKVKEVRRILPELDALISGRFDEAIKSLDQLLRERGDVGQEIDERIVILKQGIQHASRSQSVQIIRETERLAAEILLDQFPAYLTVIRELGSTEAELDATDELETEFYSSANDRNKAAIATSARQRVRIRLNNRFEEHLQLLRGIVAEEKGVSVPASDQQDESALILRAIREDWSQSSLLEQLEFIRSRDEGEELRKD